MNSCVSRELSAVLPTVRLWKASQPSYSEMNIEFIKLWMLNFIITSAAQAFDFLLELTQENNVLKPEEHQTDRELDDTEVWVKWGRRPFSGYCPLGAFISETWEEVEDVWPGVRYVDKLLLVQPLSASPPSDPIFILVLCVPPLTPPTFFLKPKYKPG